MKSKTTKAKEYEVSEEGSLGLLALGYRGLQAWREKRKTLLNSMSQNEKQKKA